MSDEDSPSYKDGDIVWVKLGNCWWPGEVTENGPEDLNVKKPPLVIVRFFNEGTYQFVNSYNQIFPYNCERKDDFIKRGMDSFRGNNTHMEKFPIDVSFAEVKTDGNPNILSDPKFAPQKKSNVIAEIFGSPVVKKTAKDGKSRGRASGSKNSTKKPSKLNITHRRFLGFDDYEAHIRLQYPGKDAEHFSDEEFPRINTESETTSNFTCSTCQFQTNRLEVMVFHVQWHSQNHDSPAVTKKKASPKKKASKKPRLSHKHITSEDDRANSSSGLFDTDEDEEVKLKPKRKRKTGTSKENKQRKTDNEKSFTDIRTNLLAEWSDSEENEGLDETKHDTSGGSERINSEDDTDKPANKEDESNSQKDNSKSCFDFDDEEEDNSIVHTAVGRKIPRVIPPNDKRKSSDPDNEDASLPIAEDDENRMEILKETEKNINENSNAVQPEPDAPKEDEEYKELLESTTVPDVPELSGTLKSQNFPNSTSIKIPDKKSENSTEVATKLTNPKKRFVKSFEDFELLQNEQRKAQEEKEKVDEPKKKEATEIKEITSEQNADGSKLDDKPEDKSQNEILEEEPKIEEKSKIEEESKVEEESKIEEEASKSEEVVEKKEVDEEKEKLNEPESTLTSENLVQENDKVESDKSDEETKINDESGVKISKLKCRLMSKIEEESSESVKSSPSRTSTRLSHRTPRSKILEIYRNDKSNEKKSIKTEEKELPTGEIVANTSKRSKHAAKKFKFLKYKEEEIEDKIEEETPTEETSKPEPEPEKPKKKFNVDDDITKLVEANELILNDLFDFEKKTPKPESPAKSSATESQAAEELRQEVKLEEKAEDESDTLHEVTLKCASNDNENSGDLDIAIKTNLTNLNKTEDEMSALTTLAMVSELENVDNKLQPIHFESMEDIVAEVDKDAVIEEHFDIKPDILPEPELVTIDGNLTVVSEKELADAQVEITADVSPNSKTPVTLTTFSMDFSDSNNSDKTVSEPVDVKSDAEISSKVEVEIPEIKEAKEPTESVVPEIVKEEELIFEDIKQIVEETPPAPPVLIEKLTAPPPEKVIKSPSKLLERLTTTSTVVEVKPKETITITKSAKVPVPLIKDNAKLIPGTRTKFVIKSATTKSVRGTPSSSGKPVILSEKIIKPEKPIGDSPGSVSVQKITSKRFMHDADEIDTFIIQKGSKKLQEEEEDDLDDIGEGAQPWKRYKKTVEPKKAIQITPVSSGIKKKGKAKILQQTIITPAGEIIQPDVPQNSSPTDDFDINSMPIVLSDEILTPESIENMPIFLSDSTEKLTTTPRMQPIVKKMAHQQPGQMRLLNKSIGSSNLITTPVDKTKLIRTPKLMGSVGQKLIKQNSFSAGKHGKFVIVSQPSSSSTPSKYTVGKKQTLIKRPSGDLAMTSTGALTKVQNMSPEPSGNKIMILTNQQGQQQRVLLTPSQQKMMGYQNQGNKVTKSFIKGNVIQKKDLSVAGSSGIMTKTVNSPRMNSNQHLISSSGQILTPIHQGKSVRIEKTLPSGRKLQVQSHKVNLQKPQKTILIKNQHGQTVRKIQGNDDALLDQQVAEQLEAIKASGVLQQKQEVLNYRSAPKTVRRSYAKKVVETPRPVTKTQLIANSPAMLNKTEAAIPPLAPISPKKPEPVHSTSVQEKASATEAKSDRPLNQLVIQDALGNQTTITEGQILALPSETIDGQPQSYMLVTLDESGNLTPLNNEALMSLDPNLGLGGDLSNTVLQIDQSALKDETNQAEGAVPSTSASSNEANTNVEEVVAEPVQPETSQKEVEEVVDKPAEEEAALVEASQEQNDMQTVNCNVSGEPGQQLIVTGDPIAAQKFLESLTEGNTDLANILASAEGSSILIHADGQQILINTESDNQMLLSLNNDNLNMTESTEGDGNPIFANQPSKNQDILAAALADTDVFQQEQNGSQNKVSQLSPNSTLYPMNVSNVLETSLTLNSPIMTPLEVPSTNSKKISDESDILNQVPKNVDLPITITDPNISQTVSQQQVASLMANELQTNLELAISDSSITATSSEMNSPSFVYSLPSLDGTVDINQKPFNSSMPLLTEDTEDVSQEIKTEESEKAQSCSDDVVRNDSIADTKQKQLTTSFLDDNEGLCTLGNEMCSSLSEPPPDMFDLSAVLSSHQEKQESKIRDEDDDEMNNKDANSSELIEKSVDKGGDESVSSESANPDTASVTETSSPNTVNEDSCEIPVQPEIVATLEGDESSGGGNKRGCTDEEDDKESKKCKFD